jgi:hypothetical protein
MKITEAQGLVRDFAKRNKWKDEPNIDKFDHIHEELIEMSRHLRYKNTKEMKKFIAKNRGIFEDGIGDLLFVSLRLANQLGVDADTAFNKTSRLILSRYNKKGNEGKTKA